MFDAVQNIPFAFILCGIIWAITMGFAVGNYACSLVHRLPRGKLLLDKTPYCGNCGTLLKVKDLFPVISAVLLKHRCRYCGEPFPTSHTWTELLVGLLFVFTFFQYNFSEHYILIVTLGTFLITLAAIEVNEHQVMGRILICVIVFGMLNRVLVDGSLYPFIEGGLYGFFLGIILKRREVRKVGHIYSLPPLAALLATGGICVGVNGLLPFCVLFAAFYILVHMMVGLHKPVRLTVPFGFAVIIPVLYPELVTF